MVQDMLLGGIDTTAMMLTVVLYHLAKNPDKQEILREEIFKLLNDKDSELTASSLNNFPYLRACMKEALRLNAPLTGNTRAPQRDIVSSGYQIPKDTDVALMTHIISTDETNFKRSKEFVPERWLKNDTNPTCPSSKDAHPFAYSPFGHGTRMCIGRRFAELEVEVLVMRILKEFKLEWDRPDLKFKTSIILSPADPLKFKVTDLK